MSSTDSISSSEDDRRQGPRPPGPPPPPPPPYNRNQPGKKKKKTKNLPPQESINKIWSRFSVPQFSKATNILPSPPPTSTDPSKTVHVSKPPPANVLVTEDYERAVQECRAKVQTLIRECKRVNMRYRDQSFDIDWDLKTARGYCLNGLVDVDFEISRRTLASPASEIPKAVKRVHEIFDKPTFLKEKAMAADIRQGGLGDCWLIACLTALVNMELGLESLCVEYDTKIGIYGFVFQRDGEWIVSIIDDKLYLKSPDWDSPSVQRHLMEQTDKEDVEKEYRKIYQTGSQALYFARCRDQNETWLPLLEKAYAKAHGDYAALEGGWIGEGLEDLTGGVTTELLSSDILDTDAFWKNEIMKVNKEFLFGCCTGMIGVGFGSRDGISEGHTYVVMEARELSTGQRLVKLRNPWGKGKDGNWEGAWSDGSKEFTPEAQIELNHKFGSDSVFWISFEDFLRKYQHFDRTRLFRDSPDWRITQKWISVEVPWHSEFQQMFKINLKKESPVVLVLSQLDNRYFWGLRGQYTFRLQFRLHKAESPGEEDYIVQSHGNYLMERSVITELQSLEAGSYIVYVRVEADRDTSVSSVEDVVKAESKKKVDNAKLIQVGSMYDLAHSKGTAHMKAKASTRTLQEAAKSRAQRVEKQRKLWEKRRAYRAARQKQDKKNAAKRDLKSANALKKEEAERPKDKGVQTEEVKKIEISTEDKAMQTDDPPMTEVSETSSETIETPNMNENDKAVQTEIHHYLESPIDSHSMLDTPRTSSIVDIPRRSRSFHPGPPPPPPDNRPKGNSSRRYHSRGPPPPPPQRPVVFDDESSASPISDFEDVFSEDEPSPKPRPVDQKPPPPPNQNKRSNASDDEDTVEPWNAVCIVGFRVYSKDEFLEVMIYDEEAEEKERKEKEAKDNEEKEAKKKEDGKQENKEDKEKREEKEENVKQTSDAKDMTDNEIAKSELNTGKDDAKKSGINKTDTTDAVSETCEVQTQTLLEQTANLDQPNVAAVVSNIAPSTTTESTQTTT